MKKALVILTAIFCVAGHAQNINGFYQPKADGHVKKVGITCPAIELTGKGIIWDFSNLEISDNESLVNYVSTDSADSIIAGIEQRTRFYYRTSNDSVLLCGYENNQNKVVYDLPQLFLHMPLTYNQQNDGFFHGTAVFCEKLFMRVFGSYSVIVDGVGSMVLPSGDTLRHVSRIHIQQHTAKRHYPNIATEEELRYLVDSIAPYTDDSIRYELAKDSVMKITDIYRWYAAGYRYPIIETIVSESTDMSRKHQAAFFCSPFEQESLEDDDNEQIRNLLASIDHAEEGKAQNNSNGTESNGNCNPILHNVQVNVNGTTITVNYDLTEDATITALVCDLSGILYRQASQNAQVGDNHQMEILCSGIRRGQYVLYLNANGNITSFAISI